MAMRQGESKEKSVVEPTWKKCMNCYRDRMTMVEERQDKWVGRRRLVVLTTVVVAAIGWFAGCGQEKTTGTRDNPYPYSQDRTNRIINPRF